MQIEPKIKPLVADLEKTGITSFLGSTDFDRLCIRAELDVIWDKFLRAAIDSRSVFLVGHDHKYIDSWNAFQNLLSSTYRSSPESFWKIVIIILDEFIRWNGQELDLGDVFTDLELINPPALSFARLKLVHEKRQKQIRKMNSEQNDDQSKVVDRIDPEIANNNFLLSKKGDWIEMIAKDRIGEVIDEIRKTAVEMNRSILVEQIVQISSRWVRMNRKINEGSASREEEDLTYNKINKALLDLVNQIDKI